MSLYLLVFGCFALGYLLKYFSSVGSVGSVGSLRLIKLLNGWIIYLALPALILSTVPRLEFSAEYLYALLTPWLVAALVFISGYLMAFLLGWSVQLRAVVILLLSLGNTAFLGVPLIRHQLDDSMLLAAIVYDQLGSFLILSFFATAVVASVASQKAGPSIVGRLLVVMRFPPFISLMFALAMSLIPQWLTHPLWQQTEVLLNLLSQTLLPMAMVVIGLQFQFKLPVGYVLPLTVILVGKLFLLPLLVFCTALWWTIAPEVAVASILQTAMPPMVTGVILLISAGVLPRFAASALGFGTLGAAITLPLWFYTVTFYPVFLAQFTG